METKEKRLERRESYLKLAVNGLTLGLAYVGFKPILDGEPVIRGGTVGNTTMELFPALDDIPWLPVAVGLSLLPFLFEFSKRIPRRVVHATKKGQLVRSDWQDVERQARVIRFSRQDSTSGDRRRDRKRQE